MAESFVLLLPGIVMTSAVDTIYIKWEGHKFGARGQGEGLGWGVGGWGHGQHGAQSGQSRAPTPVIRCPARAMAHRILRAPLCHLGVYFSRLFSSN